MSNRVTKSKLRKDGLKAASQRKRHRVQWTNRTCAKIGFMSGRGETSIAIGKAVSLPPAEIRKMTARFGLPKSIDERGRGDLAPVLVILGKKFRSDLSKAGKLRGMDMEELSRRILIKVIQDDLIGEILNV